MCTLLILTEGGSMKYFSIILLLSLAYAAHASGVRGRQMERDIQELGDMMLEIPRSISRSLSRERERSHDRNRSRVRAILDEQETQEEIATNTCINFILIFKKLAALLVR